MGCPWVYVAANIHERTEHMDRVSKKWDGDIDTRLELLFSSYFPLCWKVHSGDGGEVVYVWRYWPTHGVCELYIELLSLGQLGALCCTGRSARSLVANNR